MRLWFAVLLAAWAAGAGAFEIEKGNSGQRFKLDGGVPVVEIGQNVYAIGEVPPGALKLEMVRVLEEGSAFRSRLSSGEAMSEEEVAQVLEVYFRHTAFDFASVKIRGLKVGEPMYATWCAEWFILCLESRGAAGTLVQFESNGRNRQGGLTGYQARTLMIRKRVQESTAPSQAPAPVQTDQVPPRGTLN